MSDSERPGPQDESEASANDDERRDEDGRIAVLLLLGSKRSVELITLK